MKPYYWFFIWMGGLILLLLMLRPSLLNPLLYRLVHVLESLLSVGFMLGIFVLFLRLIWNAGRR